MRLRTHEQGCRIVADSLWRTVYLTFNDNNEARKFFQTLAVNVDFCHANRDLFCDMFNYRYASQTPALGSGSSRTGPDSPHSQSIACTIAVRIPLRRLMLPRDTMIGIVSGEIQYLRFYFDGAVIANTQPHTCRGLPNVSP